MTQHRPNHTSASLAGSVLVSTVLGVLAIVFWGSTIAVSRSLTERLGLFTAATAIYTLTGVLAAVYLAAKPKARRGLSRLPLRYWLVCGGFAVAYAVFLYVAIGLAADRAQVVEVGIVNYLWPSLTLTLSVPILGKRAGPWLYVGMAAACVGIVLAMTSGGAFSWAGFRDHVLHNPVPFLVALFAAISWASYSNLSRRWAAHTDCEAMPIFLMLTAAAFAVIRCFLVEESEWNLRVVLEVAYCATFPGLLAYLFWDIAMRKGNLTLVAALAYFTPLLSTTITCLYLHVLPGLRLWLACALVVIGATLCQKGIGERKSKPNQEEQ